MALRGLQPIFFGFAVRCVVPFFLRKQFYLHPFQIHFYHEKHCHFGDGFVLQIGLGWAQHAQLDLLSSPSASYSTEAPTGYWLELETVTAHIGGALDGQTTYRLYLNTLNENDYLSACSGDENSPMEINSSTGSWYNDFASTTWNALGINPGFFGFFPDLVYDSYLTIELKTQQCPPLSTPPLFGAPRTPHCNSLARRLEPMFWSMMPQVELGTHLSLALQPLEPTRPLQDQTSASWWLNSPQRAQ